jgi:hypothetical protein
MCEIILLIVLGKQLGTIVRNKGHKAGWYQVLLVVLWFVGEFLGAFAAAIATGAMARDGEPNMVFVYLSALFGAATGAVIAFAIAKSLTPVHEDEFADRFDDKVDYPPPRRSRRLEEGHEEHKRRPSNPDERFERES